MAFRTTATRQAAKGVAALKKGTRSAVLSLQKVGPDIRKLAQGQENARAAKEEGADDWSEFSVEKWQSGVYTTKSFFAELFDDTTDFVGSWADKLGANKDVFLVEAGCGTGEALVPLVDRVKYQVGLDFNPQFIEYCKSMTEPQNTEKVSFIVGDAGELGAVLEREVGPWMEDSVKIAMCVGNTIGIMPSAVKEVIYEEMAEVAGPDGVAIMVYWNGNTSVATFLPQESSALWRVYWKIHQPGHLHS
jgi:SAM-dependent methyltransferase